MVYWSAPCDADTDNDGTVRSIAGPAGTAAEGPTAPADPPAEGEVPEELAGAAELEPELQAARPTTNAAATIGPAHRSTGLRRYRWDMY